MLQLYGVNLNSNLVSYACFHGYRGILKFCDTSVNTEFKKYYNTKLLWGLWNYQTFILSLHDVLEQRFLIHQHILHLLCFVVLYLEAINCWNCMFSCNGARAHFMCSLMQETLLQIIKASQLCVCMGWYVSKANDTCLVPWFFIYNGTTIYMCTFMHGPLEHSIYITNFISYIT